VEIRIPTDAVPTDWQERLLTRMAHHGIELSGAAIEVMGPDSYVVCVRYNGPTIEADVALDLQLCLAGEDNDGPALWIEDEETLEDTLFASV
jgi:hypothetical protein